MYDRYLFQIGALAACLLGLSACGETGAPAQANATDTAKIVTEPPRAFELPAYFDCIREAGGVVLAAHRGGPAPGYPENALETLQHGLAAGIGVFEIDIAESRDGMLFLMHDNTLGRTTTADGAVVDTDWETIARARLVDTAGTLTEFHPPRFTDVLVWAVETGAILEVDRKSSTSFRNIVSTVYAANAQNNVVLISYNDDDVGQIAAHAPDLMLTASARGSRDITRIVEMGIAQENLIAWTGTSNADIAAFARLTAEGVEPAFGTLGRPGQRLDDLWLADGDVSEFNALIEGGLVLLATDAALELAPLLDADDTAREACHP
ncbi:MAG: glycerophosphodiester phosphodiesterase family protein [Hyphomonadaceae bacterium]|nr:glycerophosphodiester phosphodiesterase family protein [Hyphomonadaceae bacterium]